MGYWRLTAEHLPAKALTEMQTRFSDMILVSGRDPVFSTMTIFIVEGTRKQAERLQTAIHERNAGACCSIEVEPEEE
jgi:metal-responsive CopG/Arc/MetJ family transcriptional regulator